jgi:N-acyl-L-homoserine lactone synthetase
MGALAQSSTTCFADRVLQFLQRVDYRRAETAEDREAIFRLRYQAYRREGFIAPNSPRKFGDAVDDRENTWIFGVYLDDKLVSSIRMTVTIPSNSFVPALDVFPDLLKPRLEGGERFVDPSRFVTDRVSSKLHPELRYVTLRLPWLALEYFGADVMLAAVRVEHQAFYKRLWGHQTICPPRLYPNLQMHVGLMTLDYHQVRDQVHQRHPFLRSSFFERRMLFERHAVVVRRSAA